VSSLPAPKASLCAVLLTALTVLVVTGCSGSSAKSSSSSSSKGLPTVAGDYGSKPTLTYPGPTPPTKVVSTVLHEGTGKPVQKGDLLVADYLGQVWKGSVFDNSYDRKQPAGFVIGAGKVIPGWDEVLVGVKAGSRVLMSVPPAKGYGTTGNAQAGIKGTDTLVFVVDVIGSYDKAAVGDAKAAVQKVSTPGVRVTGAPGVVPTVTVAKGTKAPTAPKLTVLAKGTGAPVATGLLVVQYVASRYTGESAGSTYADGAPAGVPVSAGAGGTPFDLTRGVPLGSRVLLELPGSQGQAAVAVVLDLIAQPKPAAG
jgi:peptidylprolyl isomerase